MSRWNYILEIPEDMGYWLVRAEGGIYYDDFHLNNFIAVSDNQITLEKIKEENNNTLVGLTVANLKSIYGEIENTWNAQQISHAVGRTHRFIAEMNINDLVMVPSKNSKKFLLGLIKSDVYEVTEEELLNDQEVEYRINKSLKRRNIQWLKVVDRQDISEKLYWILSAHQAIFDLKENKDEINQLLAPIYKTGDNYHLTLKVSKQEAINNKEWLDFYMALEGIRTASNSNTVNVKTNVQSPGWIELISTDWKGIVASGVVLGGMVFGEVNAFGVKVQGILPYFNQRRKQQVEIRSLELENEAKQIENDLAKLEFEDAQEKRQIKKLENQVAAMRATLMISNFDAGSTSESSVQMQMENVD